MNRKILNVSLYIWMAFALLSAIFILFPQIDLYVSSLFFEDGLFIYNRTWLEELFFYSVQPLVILFSVIVLAIFTYNTLKKKNILNINKQIVLYILLTLTLAPGLIVNKTLKDNWGRARPKQIIEFGGNKEFTPAFIRSDQGGYSFSSGHTAAAFSLMGFVVLASRRRKVWMALALSYGVSVSIARIAAGGHFLSDTVTSFFIVYISTSILYLIIFKKELNQ